MKSAPFNPHICKIELRSSGMNLIEAPLSFDSHTFANCFSIKNIVKPNISQDKYMDNRTAKF